MCEAIRTTAARAADAGMWCLDGGFHGGPAVPPGSPQRRARLNDALDSLLDGTVVRSRGRLWVADEPDVALHLESAGCGMHVGAGGPRGGKTTQIVAITLGEPDAITAAFTQALLTDDELSFVDSIRKLDV
ncbi:GTP-binding protein [Lentzea sp. CA-135723]|uniref:GTP-binding protein n=1 Tax=Lentzea sp. CA-135723 TaxID=3239950 RepID=UPI003D934224